MTEIKVTLSSPKIIATVTQGMNGKTAYQSAVTGGYTGTEAEFNALIANIPSNASQLPFTPTGELSSTNVQTALAELDNEKASKAQEAWITPTLLNGWSSVEGATAQYYLDSIGVMHFRGRIQGGEAGTVSFVIPVGRRPSIFQYFSLPFNSTSSSIRVVVLNSSNSIYVEGSYSGWIDLSGITYRAEA